MVFAPRGRILRACACCVVRTALSHRYVVFWVVDDVRNTNMDGCLLHAQI